ncbi:MAG: GerMN domain-containing protein [Clostridiales bacterium]|nr:GerMN domain-containing protein [Clostridiales bacterium]
MSKSLTTIILVIIIAYSLSFIPLNNQLINFDFIDNIISQHNEPIDEKPIDEKVYAYNLRLEEDSNSFENPDLITIVAETDNMEYKLNNTLKFDLYQNDELVNSFMQDNILINISDESTNAKKIEKITIDISLNNLEINPGEYQMKILLDDSNFANKTVLLSLSYLEELNYVGSTNSVKSGKQYLELYFSDESLNYLIPISRLINSSDRLIRTTINNQFEGPKNSSGLMQTPIGPWSYKAALHDTTLDLYYHLADVKPYENGSAAAMYAIDSIVKSMTSIPYIDDIQFYVNEKNAKSNYFHGIDLSKPVKPLTWPTLYYGLRDSKNKVYLNPVQLYDLEYKDVFGALQAKSEIINKLNISNITADTNIIAPIPKSVELIDINLSGKTLTINLSNNFKTIMEIWKLIINS